MSSNIIGLHFGQCGNQVGFEFWKALAQEHGLDVRGNEMQCPQDQETNDQKSVFFAESDSGHFIPRAVMVDLEPRVINGIKNSEYSGFFAPGNFYMGTDGSGAGNNWASGYGQGRGVLESVMDIIQHEAECCDNLEGFLFTHSVSGGTGSGLGSYFLEQIRETFGNKIIQTYSVFANQSGAGDVIVHPYNSVLTLNRLQAEADAVVILDNTALMAVASDKFRMGVGEKPSFAQINYLVSRIMSTSTATMRFPSPCFSRLTSLVSHLVPFAPLRFLQTSMCPIVDPADAAAFRGITNVNEVMRKLLQPRNMMISTGNQRNADPGCMLAGLAIMQGQVKSSEFATCLSTGASIMRESIRRPQWMVYNPLQIGKAPQSPFVQTKVKVSGLLLSNHTSSVRLLQSTLRQYEGMRKKNAFLDRFSREEGFQLEMMDESAEAVHDLVREYKNIEQADYFNFDQ